MLFLLLTFKHRLDGKAVFRLGLLSIRSKLEQRAYTSVSSFSRDLANVFTSEIGVESVGDTAELQMQISGRAPELSLEQREKRKLAKRIIKAIQPALEDSLRKESELNGKPFEKELKDLDVLLENSVLSRRGSLVAMNGPEAVERYPLVNGIKTDVEGDHMEAPETSIETLHAEPEEQAANEDKDVTMVDVNGGTDTGHGTKESSISETNGVVTAKTFLASQPMEGRTKNQAATSSSRDIQMASATSLTSPVDSLASKDQPPLSQGGIQWYMQPFDPIGTTIHEERWTGRDVLRGMSEELSEIGEDELRNLVGDEPPEYVPDLPNGGPGTSSGDGGPPADAAVAGALKLKTHKTRRRWKGFR